MKRQVKKPSLKLNKDTAKIPSPTNLPPTIPEERSPINGPMSNGPSTGAPHLTASNAVRPPTSHSYRNSPSPTSPSYAPSTHTLNEQSNDHTSRNYHDSSRFSTSTVTPSDSSRAHASSTSSRAPNHPMTNIPINNGSTLSLPDPPNSATSSTTPSAEIFKSFRVSKEDPCYKVLPAALKRYNIDADPGCYALYIVHGDQERCLGREERPLLLFKKLAEEGRKPMFMLRKHNSPVHGYSTTTLNPGSEGGAPPTGKPGFALPGGVI